MEFEIRLFGFDTNFTQMNLDLSLIYTTRARTEAKIYLKTEHKSEQELNIYKLKLKNI